MVGFPIKLATTVDGQHDTETVYFPGFRRCKALADKARALRKMEIQTQVAAQRKTIAETKLHNALTDAEVTAAADSLLLAYDAILAAEKATETAIDAFLVFGFSQNYDEANTRRIVDMIPMERLGEIFVSAASGCDPLDFSAGGAGK